MGTKIEYAINLLGTSPNSNGFTVHGVDDWNYFLNSGLKVKSRRSKLENKIRNSMDRMLDRHNVDSIRRSMQMHEDIFNYQVKELHRLYGVQKKLMSEVKKEINKQSRSRDPRINSTTTATTTNSDRMNHSQFINWHNPNTATPQFITTASSANNFHIHTLREDFTSKERSGSCSGDTARMSRGFDLERPAAEEDMSTGISVVDEDHRAATTTAGCLSSHNLVLKGNKMMTVMMSTATATEGSDDEESEVELTLSIGSCLSKKKSKSRKPNQLDSSVSFKADHGAGGDCSDPTTPMSSSSATFDPDRKQPHWLFHGLKLK